MARIRTTVDGLVYEDDVEPRMLLVQYLRERLGKTGTAATPATAAPAPSTWTAAA